MEYERWKLLMQAFDFSENKKTYESLIQAYSEKHRHYHNKKHIDAILKHFDDVAYQIEHPYEVELSLWFHDAIYKPQSNTNELDSANWASEFLSNNFADKEVVGRVYALIMATLHGSKVNSIDQMFIIDIDLTILGSEESIFNQFEKNIRKEYKWAPDLLYKKKRKAILKNFLSRERIFYTVFFLDKFESQARLNLNNSINMLWIKVKS